MAKLGIVLPVYKAIFFEDALKSIANQTCTDFTVYIGNDGSNEDFESVIESYRTKIPIVYKRFSKNLGGKDLVGHWERCIDMLKDEEWIWLFSDDDIMGSTCVENFYKSLSTNNNVDLFHFNISRINEQNTIIENCVPFPPILHSEDFLTGRLQDALSSCVLEYIFKRDHFLNNRRFQNFDLAWGSDDATWIKLGIPKGIHTIENSHVFWRKSSFNISPNKRDKNIVLRKIRAQISFAQWAMEKVNNNELKIEKNRIKNLLTSWFIKSIKQSFQFFTLKGLMKILTDFFYAIGETNSSKPKAFSLYIYKIYRKFADTLKKAVLRNAEV